MSAPQSRRQFLGHAALLGLSAGGLALLGGCALNPDQGSGPAAARVARVGYLRATTDEGAEDEAPRLNNMRQGLREAGRVDGENLFLEARLAQGDPAALPN